MTTSFYAPPSCFRGGRVTLPDDEATHAVRVLRHQPGDEVIVVDGVGGRHRVRLDRVDRRRADGQVLETWPEVGEPAYRLSLGLALLKQRSRFETFLEKAVELGVTEILPLATARTEKLGFKADRAEKLMVSAMKQSGRCRLPTLAPPRPLPDVLADDPPDLALLAHEAAPPDAALAHVLAAHPDAQTLRLLIGPEGGFSEDEVAAARQAHFHVVSLGPRRLRAETAALVAASAVMLARSG